jgi:hypothetical protein
MIVCLITSFFSVACLVKFTLHNSDLQEILESWDILFILFTIMSLIFLLFVFLINNSKREILKASILTFMVEEDIKEMEEILENLD